ncbi:hypothetical protein ONE63_006152 [Megalurothrips usitatus]|uniref:AH domain-containing protein n=1 Tax=Megalurothrips usitatus TaxID=439358 RepID=A0AAV7XZF6_9NEOP|nr:hypothetical protein ONE63_006152 [Megalurothrips usitatus]
MNGYGYSSQGVAAEPWSSRNNASAMSKMEHTFWVTKQSVFRKLGKKDDECIVASDAELDAKLELFRSVQDTCLELQRILDKYQERLCNLAQEESAMGRFLKECSKRDQTNAGKAMVSVGRALSYSGQQRLALRVPLQRLHQEVETFRQRAIEDTLLNVSAMERQRTEYRAALSWMKNISQELDPDTHKQLEKFRKVQGQVRQSKANFDRLKLDCLQKVDLLAAARCNMFSHALTLYQQNLIQHARRAHRAFGTVAKDIKGYQHYEFSVVPELTEESSRLAKQTKEADNKTQEEEETEKDGLLFFDTEYHDKVEEAAGDKPKSDSLQNLLNSAGEIGVPLIPLDLNDPVAANDLSGMADLLASENLQDLSDVLSSSFPDALSGDMIASGEWDSLFKFNATGGNTGDSVQLEQQPFSTSNMSSFTNSEGLSPSQLLDNFVTTLKLESPLETPTPLGSAKNDKMAKEASSVPLQSDLSFMSSLMNNLRHQGAPNQTTAQSNQSPQTSNNQIQNKVSSASKKDMSAWYDLFADLDPLANPDAIESKIQEEERNC